jgi:glutaredoxin 3
VVSITVYTTNWCGYCTAAKALLGRKGLEFTEINLTGDPGRKAALKEKYGWRTVPMILVGERFIGGFAELSKLEKSGALDALLRGEEPER